jgi:hypothetical protein
MKTETVQQWLLQLDAMIAKLDEAARLGGLNQQEKWALGLLKDAVVSFEASIEEREQGVCIPPGTPLPSGLKPR